MMTKSDIINNYKDFYNKLTAIPSDIQLGEGEGS